MLQKNKLSSRFKFEKHIETPQDYSPVKEELLEKVQSSPVWYEFSQEKQKGMINGFLKNKIGEFPENLVEEMYKSTVGWGPVQALIDNEKVDKIFINGTNSIYIEINGKILNTEIHPDKNDLKVISNYLKKDLDKNTANFKKDGFYISFIKSDNLNLSLKRIVGVNAETLYEKDFITHEIFDFICDAVNNRKNIVVSGGINSKKTEFLDVLISNFKKRSVLLEQSEQISADYDGLIKFIEDNDSFNSNAENIIRLMPEYIFSDLNFFPVQISEYKGFACTLRAASFEDAFKKIISSYMAMYGMHEKYAKSKALTDIDYIVHIDGKIKCVIELTPAKTISASFKTVLKRHDL